MRALTKATVRATLVAGLFTLALPAATIFDSGVTALNSGDPTQLGRLSRSGVISDWSTPKAYPGEINLTTSYHYLIFDVAIPSYYPFVQITIDSLSVNTFASAYLGSYNPTAADVNYLGDAGTSGNAFGTDPIAFQVVMPSTADLIVLVNETAAAGGGLGQNFDILVEGFTDTMFDDAVPAGVPEPLTFGLTGAALFAIILTRRRRITTH